MNRPLSSVLLALVTLSTLASPALAIEKCKAKVDRKTGVISVDASGAGGPVLWGATEGNESNSFFNAGTCAQDSSWKKCQLADPSTLASKTPPPACTLYLDDGVQACQMWISGCIPGPREVSIDLVQLDGDLTQLQADVGQLDADVSSDLSDLTTRTQCMTSTATDLYVTNCNLHVVSGSGATDGAVNGRGNIIVGYDENIGNPKTGSHNIVVGRWHSYTSFGGIVAGENNTISNANACVVGGRSSAANGISSTVSGGYLNTADGDFSSISGGASNVASGNFGSVAGGSGNVASGGYSSVSGGDLRTASGSRDWRAGSLLEDF